MNEAIDLYSSAIGFLDKAKAEHPNSRAIQDSLASAWANQGLAWRTSEDPAAVERALAAFDRAIELREGILISGNPLYRYNLAGVWINWADVLQERGTAQDLVDALKGYDRAIAVLSPLCDEFHPLVDRRIAVVRLNRIGLLLAKTGIHRLPELLSDIDHTLGVLARHPGKAWTRVLSALASAQRAEGLIRLGSWSHAESQARDAINGLGSIDDAESLAVALRARHMLCLCLMRASGDASGAARVDEAVDCAEEGLTQAVAWRSDKRIGRDLSALFGLAADGYARNHPQFVTEFIEEHLSFVRASSTPEQANGIASRAVATAMGLVANRVFRARDAAEAENAAAVFRGLRSMADRLAS